VKTIGGCLHLYLLSLAHLVSRALASASARWGGGVKVGMPVTHCAAQAPREINNFGEALTAICSLTLFPMAPGVPTHASWEACHRELTKYV
jgi:hypothetical protein